MQNSQEEILFKTHTEAVDIEMLPLVFIIGSPRTGSTLLYQLLINAFGFFYFSNVLNDHYPENPAVGAALDPGGKPALEVGYKSEYGKTEHRLDPSEASGIFRNWFGGGHPSQLRSSVLLPGKKRHMVQSLKTIYGLFQKPILTKNAWNSFRIRELAGLFPGLSFVWIRRDIIDSASSDLIARYRAGSPETWNSATPANYREIQTRPYWEQVVEQQYEYTRIIGQDLHRYAPGRFIDIWYEDICFDCDNELTRMDRFFESVNLQVPRNSQTTVPVFKRTEHRSMDDEDTRRLKGYVENHPDRFQGLLYKNRAS